jgi:hypothetical protein
MSISIVDTYKLLFGRKGIADGNVIELAEHGRSGGVSSGQPFKFTDSIKYDMKIVEDGTIIYIAYANPGTAEATEAWAVQKLDTTTGIKATWANGNCNFENAATDLPSLFA